MKIGKYILLSDIILAPLAGYTDIGFRTLCRRYGAGLTYTEMISAKGLMYGNDKTENLLVKSDCEYPSAVQLFGRDPEIVSNAAERLEFDIIDINMGCPVPKIVKNGEGSALMREPKLAQEIVNECVRKCAPQGKAITVKFRASFGDSIKASEFAKYMEDGGASAITVHGRSREQMYSGTADWGIIEETVKSVSIPVIGNGDVVNDKAVNHARNIGCAGIMIGRGALGKPYIFSDLQNKIYELDRENIVLEHIDILSKYFNEHYVVGNMKKHICYYTKGEKNSRIIKEKIYESKTIEELKSIIHNYLA